MPSFPGLMLAVMLGAGIASFVYFMFNNAEQPHQQTYENSYSYNSEPFREYPRPNSENGVSRRKRSRNPGKKECSICMEQGGDESCWVSLSPCLHKFHRKCIFEWERVGEASTCPNCRSNFQFIT